MSNNVKNQKTSSDLLSAEDYFALQGKSVEFSEALFKLLFSENGAAPCDSDMGVPIHDIYDEKEAHS